METIGQQLRTAREHKKITLDAAAQATKIKSDHLSALESNQFEHIEAPVYVKGFLRIYAGFLGLDPKPLVEQYLHGYNEPQNSPSPMPPAPIAKTTAPPPSENQQAFSPALVITLLCVTVGLFILVWVGNSAITWWKGHRTGTTPTEIVAATPATATARPQVSPYLQPKDVSPAQIIEPQHAVRTLTVRADDTCEITVIVDGAIKFRDKMLRNEVRRFEGQRNFKIQAKDGNAVHVWVGQKDMGKLGRRGELIEKQF